MPIAKFRSEQGVTLAGIVGSITELRPLPAIALRLIDMAADDRFSAQDLAQAISTDQALTAKILRFANSPLLGMPRRVTSLREAVVLLGFRQVRSLALAACMIDLAGKSRQEVLAYAPFWRNSLIVGTLAQALAEADGRDGEPAFTAGVLHNIGRLSLAQQRPREFAALFALLRPGLDFHDLQRAHFGFTDADIGAAMTRLWKFPDPLCDAVARHAAPLDSFLDATALDATVARARRYARAHALTDGIDAPSGLTPDPEWEEPDVAKALARRGGIEGIVAWSESFLDLADAA